VKIAIIVVVLLNLNGEIDHKTTIEEECPEMNIIANKLEEMKSAGRILDYGAACLPAKFEHIDGIPL
jgi:hypothetical protein